MNHNVLVSDAMIPSSTTATATATTKYYLAAKYVHRQCCRAHNAIAIMIHAMPCHAMHGYLYASVRKCDSLGVLFYLVSIV